MLLEHKICSGSHVLVEIRNNYSRHNTAAELVSEKRKIHLNSGTSSFALL